MSVPLIEPFTINIPEPVIERILERVRGYPWRDLPNAGGWSCGTSLVLMRDLCTYWTSSYDWRAAERELNRLPQFRAQAAGLGLHFVYLRGSGPNPLPLILSHGWPGSFAEFLHVAEPLAHPERFGGDPQDAFDVVISSLPGYAFSDRPARPVGPRTTAKHFDALMTAVLGYGRYLAQGGDWGRAVSAWMGYNHSTNTDGACAGVHLNMVSTRAAGMVAHTDEEREWEATCAKLHRREGAYFELQSTKPQSLAYAMMDSPVGVAAWIVEKFAAWSDLEKLPSGEPDVESRYTKDQLLTNVMIYLVTRTFATASWLYRGLYDDKPAEFPLGTRVEV